MQVCPEEPDAPTRKPDGVLKWEGVKNQWIRGQLLMNLKRAPTEKRDNQIIPKINTSHST